MITCNFEDKGVANLRHVTVNALVIHDDNILLAKRGTYGGGKPLLEAGKWALLGGFLSRDESLEQGLKREVTEESGWKIDNLRMFHIKDNPDRPAEDRQNIEFVFICDAVDKIKSDDEEVRELKWYKLEDLPPMDLMAFDHGDDLRLYLEYIKTPFSLPKVGK